MFVGCSGNRPAAFVNYSESVNSSRAHLKQEGRLNMKSVLVENNDVSNWLIDYCEFVIMDRLIFFCDRPYCLS